jgi:hypothetical protein
MRRIQLIFCTVGIDGAFGATAGGAAPQAAKSTAVVMGTSSRVIRIICAQSIDCKP